MLKEVKIYYISNKIKSYYSTKNNKFHNENGPAIIDYYENGNIKFEKYFINDELHNINGPAIISYNELEQIEYAYHFLNDKRHNINGPAIIYYKNGKIKYEGYFINGIIYNKKMYHRMIKLLPFS